MYKYGYDHMLGGVGGSGLLMTMIQLILLVDLILLGAWLWKQVKKKK